MTERNAHKSNFNGNLFLLAAGWIAVALPGFGQGGAAESEAAKVSAPVYGQLLHSDGLLPSFETATLRPSNNLPVSYWGWGPYGYVIKTPMSIPARSKNSASARPVWPYELHALDVTVADFIGRAYGISSNDQLVGAPEWVVSQGYDLDAKVGDDVAAALKANPSDLRNERLMFQSLLAEQMKLKVHFETRKLPVYELVIANGGPKLTSAKDADGSAKGFLLARWPAWTVEGLTLDEFVEDHSFKFLPDLGGHLVVNKTGPTRAYDFDLIWANERTAIGCNGDGNGLCFTAGPDANTPSLFTALQAQAALQLVLTTAPVEVVVIDHVDSDGKVASEKVVSGPPMLRQAALDSIQKWHFKPFEIHGTVASAITTLTVPFSLEKQKDGPTADQEEAAQAWFPLSNKCRTDLKEQNTQDALDHCKQALDTALQAGDLTPSYQLALLDSHQSYGHAMLVAGRLQEALVEEGKAVDVARTHLKETDQEYAMPFYWRAIAEAKLGQREAASADLTIAEETHRRAIAHLPEMKKMYSQYLASILKQHATLLDEMGKPEEAAKLRAEASSL